MNNWRFQGQLYRDYQEVFGTPAGKRVLYDMMKESHCLHPSYTKGDSHETAFREGERNQVLRILTYLRKQVAEFEREMTQGEEDEQRRRRATAR